VNFPFGHALLPLLPKVLKLFFLLIAARTNFLLSLGTLIKRASRIEIPVYFCDSIITPSEYTEELFTRVGYGERKVDTAKGTFSFSRASRTPLRGAGGN